MGKKRKRDASPGPVPCKVVAAASNGDAAELASLLGSSAGRGGRRRKGSRRAALASFAGCPPLIAAVLGNNAECVKLVAALVDVNAHLQEPLDSHELQRTFPQLPKRPWLDLAFRQGCTALHGALRLGLFEAAGALLEAGADVNRTELHSHETPLVALNMLLLLDPYSFGTLRGGQRRTAEQQAGEAGGGSSSTATPPAILMLRRLCDAGADPLLPPQHPFLTYADPELAAPCIDWLLEAHSKNANRTSTAGVVLALQAAIQHSSHAAAYYPRLLAMVQRRRARVSPWGFVQLLAVARHGTEQALRDVLSLGADPSAPAAAKACLLAQAAMHSDPQQGEALLQALLGAKAQLRVEDICCAVKQNHVGALNRLLRIGRPQPDPAVPRLLFQGNPSSELDHEHRLSCPVLLNLDNSAAVVQHTPAKVDFSAFVLEQLRDRMDIAEALGAAGYSPMQYHGRNRRRDLGEAGAVALAVLAGNEEEEEEEEGPWEYVPLHHDPPRRYAVHGSNRLLMVALERPPVGPATLHRFPRRFQSAVRTMLLILQHGQMLGSEEDLSTEQLAVLCCYRRQQIYRQLDAAEEEAEMGPASPLGRYVRRSHARRLVSWAEERGWEPPKDRQRRQAAAAAAAAAAAGSDGGGGGGAGAAGPPQQQQQQQCVPQALPGTLRERAQMLQAQQTDVERRLEAMMERRRANREEAQAAAARDHPQLQQLLESERRLERRLIGGGLAAPPLPLVPHPLRRLPHELLMHILQLAAYPLSCWAGEEGDFAGFPDEEVDGPEQSFGSPPYSP